MPRLEKNEKAKYLVSLDKEPEAKYGFNDAQQMTTKLLTLAFSSDQDMNMNKPGRRHKEPD